MTTTSSASPLSLLLRLLATTAAASITCATSGCGSPTITFSPTSPSTWPAPAVPAWSHQERLVITDDGDNTLAIVSTTSPPMLLGYAPAADNPIELQGPHHLSASPDGAFLYVNLSNFAPNSNFGPSGVTSLGSDPGKLLKFDAATYHLVADTQVDRDPGDNILTSDGKTAYVSHYDQLKLQTQLLKNLPASQGDSTIAVVDTATMSAPSLYPVCPTAHGLALSPDEKSLYIACSLADQFAIMDTTTHAVTLLPIGPNPGPTGQPNYFPFALTRSPSDDTIWISCNGASGESGWPGLRVYDPHTGKMDDTRALPLPGVPMFSAFLPDRTTLVVPQQGIDRLSFIDIRTSTELRGIDLPPIACQRAHMVTISDDGATAWLTCEGDHTTIKGTLVELDLASYSIRGFVELGLYSDGLVRVPPAP